MKYSPYCTEKCPVGKSISNNYINSCESVFDAVLDTRYFIDQCKAQGCKYLKEMQEFDSKSC